MDTKLPLKHPPNHPESPLRLIKRIGTGTFSHVYLAIDSCSKKKVAVKKILTHNQTTMDTIKNEIRIMQQLKQCPGVIRLEDAFCDEHQNVFLVMELAQCSLMDLLLKRNRAFSENDARDLFVQIARTVFALHRQNIVHRDIKLDNIYIVQSNPKSNSSSKHKYLLKLGDFGFATIVPTPDTKLNVFCGTPQYAAPELVSGQPYDGKKVDIWALGVVLYCLVCGKFPFTAKCSPNDPNYYNELYASIQTKPLKFRSGVVLSHEIKALLRKMLDKDPDRRPDISDVLTHSWTLPLPYRSLVPTASNTSRLSVSSNIPNSNNTNDNDNVNQNHVVISDTNDSRMENDSHLEPNKRVLTLRLRRKTRSLSNCGSTRRSL